MKNLIRGIIFALGAFLSILVTAPIILIPILCILPFAHSLYTRSIELLQFTWFSYMSFLFEYALNIKFVITGDNLKNNEDKCLIISNHRTRTDWLNVWSFFCREGRLQNFRIILKDDLKKLPPFCWPMQLAGFLFIKRNWESDKSHLENTIKLLGAKNYPTQLFVFPEGTDLTPTNIAKCNKYAQENLSLEPFEYCLHPRRTGFAALINMMRKYKNIDSVFDWTIGYVGNVPQNESAVLFGMPSEVHINFKRYAIDSLPDTDAGLGEWLQDKWFEKEKLLKQFYAGDHRFPQKTPHASLKSESDVFIQQLWCSFIWLTLTVLGIYFMFSSSYYFWFTVSGWIFLHSFTLFKGLDTLELLFHAKSS